MTRITYICTLQSSSCWSVEYSNCQHRSNYIGSCRCHTLVYNWLILYILPKRETTQAKKEQQRAGVGKVLRTVTEEHSSQPHGSLGRIEKVIVLALPPQDRIPCRMMYIKMFWNCNTQSRAKGCLWPSASLRLLWLVQRRREGCWQKNVQTSDFLPKSSSLQNCLENVKGEFGKSGQPLKVLSQAKIIF